MFCNVDADPCYQYVQNILLNGHLASTYILIYRALCMLRVYALYGRSRRVLDVLLFLGVASVFIAAVGIFHQTPK